MTENEGYQAEAGRSHLFKKDKDTIPANEPARYETLREFWKFDTPCEG